MDQAFIIVANRDNMAKVAAKGVFGLNSRGVLGRAKPGDGLVAYIKGEKRVAGIGTVTEGHHLDDQPLFEGGLYADRIGVDLGLLPEDRWKDMWELIDEVEFPSDKFNWWASLAGGIRRISVMDFEVFKRHLVKET